MTQNHATTDLSNTPLAGAEQYRTLALSTGHLTLADALELDRLGKDPEQGMVQARDTGYFIKLYTDPSGLHFNYRYARSANLRRIIELALENDFAMIEFDGGIPAIDTLPTFDWLPDEANDDPMADINGNWMLLPDIDNPWTATNVDKDANIIWLGKPSFEELIRAKPVNALIVQSNTLANLTDLLEQFCKQENLELQSANDILYEDTEKGFLTLMQRRFLEQFVQRWETLEA